MPGPTVSVDHRWPASDCCRPAPRCVDIIRPRRHGREARSEQPLGIRRAALPGRRGRLLHQRLHAGQRRVARGGCLSTRPVVPGSPYGRRRMELRVGGGLGPWAVKFARPFRWSFSVLSAVDCFRAAACQRRRGDPIRASPRRRLAAGAPPPRARVVRDRCAAPHGRTEKDFWIGIDLPSRRSTLG